MKIWITKFYITRLDLQFTAPKLKIFETQTIPQIAYFLINPNTKTAPVFRSRADAELTAKLYSKAPVLIEERPEHPEGDKNPWGISFQRMFDMSNDSGFFEGEETLERKGFTRISANWEHSDGRRYVPLYEAKMIHHYDHRWATYEGEDEEQGTRDVTLEEKQDPNFEPTPRYWCPKMKWICGHPVFQPA